MKLTNDGINDEKVVSRESVDGGIRLVTERRGKDNDRDALIRYTYMIRELSFSIRERGPARGLDHLLRKKSLHLAKMTSDHLNRADSGRRRRRGPGSLRPSLGVRLAR